MMRLLICLLAAASASSVYAKSRVVNEILVTESGDLGTLALHQPSFRAWLDDPEPANYKSYDWSTSKSYSNPIAIRITDGVDSQLFANLHPGSNYTWKVGGFTGTFTAEDQAPRTVSAYFGEEEMVWNFRDLGGWRLIGSSRRAKYGVFYRSSYWVGYDTEAKRAECPMNSEFGIRCHIDLRADSGYTDATVPEYSPAMPAGDTSVRFFNYGVDQHFQKPGSGYAGNYGKIFQTLGQRQFRPAVFHCAGGLDRTETVAFFIEALCGVEWVDILRDDIIGAFRQGRPSNVPPSELRNALFSDARYEKYGNSLAGHTRAYLEELGVTYDQIAEITMAYVGEMPETVLARVDYFEEHGERLPPAMDHGDENTPSPIKVRNGIRLLLSAIAL